MGAKSTIDLTRKEAESLLMKMVAFKNEKGMTDIELEDELEDLNDSLGNYFGLYNYRIT